MNYLFNPDNWEWLWTGNNFKFLLEGFLVNLELALIGIVLSLIFGLLLALMRISNLRPISFAAGIWVDVWRNLPLILIILYLALAVPTSWRQAWSDAIPGFFPEALQDELVLGAMLGLVLYNSAVPRGRGGSRRRQRAWSRHGADIRRRRSRSCGRSRTAPGTSPSSGPG